MAVVPDHVIARVECPRCEETHWQLVFHRLAVVGEFSHFATCPNMHEPVLLHTTLCTLSVCGKANAAADGMWYEHEHDRRQLLDPAHVFFGGLGYVIDGYVIDDESTKLSRTLLKLYMDYVA